MTDHFTFDLDHIDEIVARLSALAGFVGDHLDEIERKVKTLTGSGWDGAAAAAYAQAHREWATAAREFADGRGGYGYGRSAHPEAGRNPIRG